EDRRGVRDGAPECDLQGRRRAGDRPSRACEVRRLHTDARAAVRAALPAGPASFVSVVRTRPNDGRRPDGTHGGFRVVPERSTNEETFVVVTREGAPLYSFSDLRAATAEAATLNAAHDRRR